MRRTTIFMPEDLDRRLQAASRQTHRPRSELIREALTAYLQQLQPRKPRSLGVVDSDDGAVSSENVKDWVRAEWDRHADTR